MVAVYREADDDPKEQFLYHAAGLLGMGGSSYIDSVILRDDHVAAWDAAADSTLERRAYYVQNWRSDVVALTADNGRVLERAWYEPYGVPHGLPAKDLTTSNTGGNDDYGVPNGDADLSDQLYFNTLHGGSSPRADVTGSTSGGSFDFGRPNSAVDSDDSTYWSGLSAQPAKGRNTLSSYSNAADLRNRKGLAGYEWDPSIKKYHVRNRVLDPEIGRWTRRDPMGYVDGASFYSYARATPYTSIDPLGYRCVAAACIGQVGQRLPTGLECIRETRTLADCLACCEAPNGQSDSDCIAMCDHVFRPDPILNPPGSGGYICTFENHPDMTDKECCDLIKHEACDKGDFGGVVCCNGREVACVWPDNYKDDAGRPFPPGFPGLDLVIKCAEIHETDHFGQDCSGCGETSVCRPALPSGDTKRRTECSAYHTELECLDQRLNDRSGKIGCKLNADFAECLNTLKDRKKRVCEQLREFCGTVPPSCGLP